MCRLDSIRLRSKLLLYSDFNTNKAKDRTFVERDVSRVKYKIKLANGSLFILTLRISW